MVNVEIVYAPVAKPLLHFHVTLPLGATVAMALAESGILSIHPEVSHLPLGIFAKRVSLDTPVHTGDRIEIYRSLMIDPKENRRHRAKQTSNNSRDG